MSDLVTLLQLRQNALVVQDHLQAQHITQQINAFGFDVVDTAQGPSLIPRSIAAPGRGRGRGRGASAVELVPQPVAVVPQGRGRGRGTTPAITNVVAAPSPVAVVPQAHIERFDLDDDDLSDDEDEVGELAEAMANEWATFGNAIPPGRDWKNDRPDSYAARESIYENDGRPAEHQWQGVGEAWPMPAPGQEAAPRDLGLEAILFATGQGAQGINFDRYADIPVQVTGNNVPPPATRFDELPLGNLLHFNVQMSQFTTPTPVQKYSVPIVLAGRDLMACAQTGSGKTAAFLLPILALLLKEPRPAPPVATGPFDRQAIFPKILVLAPTRELATQIHSDAKKFAYRSWVRPCVVYGGADMAYQVKEVRGGCTLLVATPGRLIDFTDRGIISLQQIKFLVLDEADRMLDMGFEPQIRAIVQQLPANTIRQTLMFSATFPRQIQILARDFLRPDYLFLTVGRVGAASENIAQQILYVEENDKLAKVKEIVQALPFPPSLVLIFVNMKRTADILENKLRNTGFRASAIHGDLKQWEREMSLAAFKDGSRPILVATDVAARGLDIPHVSHVINYDMSQQIDDYVHRIGRTGRAGHTGLAITFFNRTNGPVARDLERLLKENNLEVPPWLAPLAYVRREGGVQDRERRGGNYGGKDVRFDTGIVDSGPPEPSDTMDPAHWDRVMQAQKKKQGEPTKRVYASVVVVDTKAAKPSWMDDDDEPMSWGNDAIPTNLPRRSKK